MAALKLLLVASLFTVSSALIMDLDADASANPIRKVVSLLQNMQKEIDAEGAKEKELFDKFMCYCSGGEQDLKMSAEASATRITQLQSRIKSETAEKSQMAQELKGHEEDRKTAKGDLESAQAIRGKEQGENQAAVADFKANVAAVSRATAGIEKGMGGAALMQLPGADRLSNLLDNFQFSDPQDRKHLIAYIQENGDYAPASGQIVGILKSMGDQMSRDLKQTEGDEAQAVEGFADLKSSKEQEVQLATESIATKTERSGSLAVSVAQATDDLEDTELELADAQKFLSQLSSQCATKETEWAARQKVRQEEITAIGEAIGILNDDDALDLFKKAIPSSLAQTRSVGFLQRGVATKASMAQRAQAFLAQAAASATGKSKAPFKLLLYTMNSKIRLMHKEGENAKEFDEVIKMIDNMVALLEKNQADDDHQKDWCGEEFHTSAGEEKKVTRQLGMQSARIEELADGIVQLKQDIENLKAGIESTDKSVVVATDQRKTEHEEYVHHMTMTNAAKGLVEKARNRLSKFYSPTEYKAPTTTAAPDSPYGFVQVGLKHQSRVAPPQAPDTFSGSAPAKNSQSGGVISLMKMIAHELEMDMQDAEHDEREAQKDYTETMNDSQQERAQDSKSITDKESAKAEKTTKLTNKNEAKRSSSEQLRLVQEYIRNLHSQCDFTLKNFDERKVARATEKESLESAKATLSGMR